MIVVPNIEDGPAFQAQAYPDRVDLLDARNLADAGTGVVSGCAVSPLATPGYAVQVASGTVQTANGPSVPLAAVASIAPAAPSTSDRRDLLVCAPLAPTIVRGGRQAITVAGVMIVVNGVLYTCTTAGITAYPGPTWPTVIGAFVTDGTVQWQVTSRVPRLNSTAYSVGQIVLVNGTAYTCTVAGTTAAAAPTFPQVYLSTVTDGTVTWQATGGVMFVTGTPTAEPAVPWTDASAFANPVKPPIPSGSFPLAEVYVKGGATTFDATCIYDKSPHVVAPGSAQAAAILQMGDHPIEGLSFLVPAFDGVYAYTANSKIGGTAGVTFGGTAGNLAGGMTFTASSAVYAGEEVLELGFAPPNGIGHVPTVLLSCDATPSESTTVAASDNGLTLTSILTGTLNVGSTTGFPSSGRILVNTSGGVAILGYTSTTAGAFSGLTLLVGSGSWTVATGDSVVPPQIVLRFSASIGSLVAGTGSVVITALDDIPAGTFCDLSWVAI